MSKEKLPLDVDYGSLFRLHSGSMNSEICFFGSSRTYFHINPKILEKKLQLATWNYSMDGTNFDHHFFTLKQYLKYNKAPKVVFMEVGVRTLDNSVLQFRKLVFAPFKNIDIDVEQLFEDSWQQIVVNKLLKVDSFRYNKLSTLKIVKNYVFPSEINRDTEIAQNDVLFINGSALQLSFLRQIDRVKKEDNYFISNGRRESIEELVQFMEQKSIKLVMLDMPSIEFLSDKNFHESRKFYRELEEAYPNLRYLDFCYDEDFQNKPELWTDYTHLSKFGADILTEKIVLFMEKNRSNLSL